MTQLREMSQEQKDFYAGNGYLIGLPPIFTPDEVEQMNRDLKELAGLLESDETMMHIREWHLASKWLFDLCAHPQILNYVEGVLGPNFFVWGSQFFPKAPHSKAKVAWHQDDYYWGMGDHNSVTVWLAFTDVDDDNGAMRVIPGSHKAGLLKHKTSSDDSVLTLEMEEGTFSEADARTLVLRRGEISLHDDSIIHGSGENVSDRWRIGLTIRYSIPAVTGVRHPIMLRGEDNVPNREYGRIPVEKFARLSRDYHAGDTANRSRR